MATWNLVVQSMGAWYAANVHTYQGTRLKPRKGRTPYLCPLVGHNVYDDCSGFTSACLLLFGCFSAGDVPTSGYFASTTSSAAAKLRKAGFTPLAFSWSTVLPFDIMALKGHVEIFAGGKQSYAWGNVHDAAKGGLPCYVAKEGYTTIWRNNGVSIDTPLNLTAGDMQSQMNQGYGTGGTFGGNYGSLNNYTSNTYPVHSEYETVNGTGGSIFSSAAANQIRIASSKLDSSATLATDRTRIYSTNDASIVLDELALPLDYDVSSDINGPQTTTNTAVKNTCTN